LRGRVSAYRLHVDDPVHFEKSIEISLDHGLVNTMTGDYSTVAYWYQLEPHQSFPELPSLARRLPSTCWITTSSGRCSDWHSQWFPSGGRASSEPKIQRLTP
jgi:hypothetical protein